MSAYVWAWLNATPERRRCLHLAPLVAVAGTVIGLSLRWFVL